MPPLPPVPNVLQVRFTGIAGQTSFAHILHIRFAGTSPTAADLDSLAASAGQAWMVGGPGSVMSTAMGVKQCTVTDLTTPSSARGVANITGGGSNSGALQPGQVAIVVSWSISRRYRGGHPRTYMPGVTATMLQDNRTVLPAFEPTLQTAATSFINAVLAATWGGFASGSLDLVNVSYHSGHALRPTPVVDHINAAVIHSRIDSMRRRLGKEA